MTTTALLSFYPFFMDCSSKERDVRLKSLLRSLAFGIGGLIFRRNDAVSFLRVDEAEFKIPRTYSAKDHAKLRTMLNGSNVEYDDLEKAISESRVASAMTKKTDRVRSIDAFLARTVERMDVARSIKSAVTLAICLKIYASANFRYDSSGDLTSIDGASDADALETVTSVWNLVSKIFANDKCNKSSSSAAKRRSSASRRTLDDSSSIDASEISAC